MRSLLLCAVGALALSACQREPEPEAAMAPAADEAVATDTSAMAPANPPAASSSNSRAMAAGDAGVDTAASAPATDGGMMSGPSPEVRDAAKEKAEQTNLHPAG